MGGGDTGGREGARPWESGCSREGKVAKGSGGEIWERLEYLFKEFGFPFAPVGNGRSRALKKDDVDFRQMILTRWIERVRDERRKAWFGSSYRGAGGTWVAQFIRRPALDFGSSHDLTVRGFEPHVGLCADSMGRACDSLSPSLSAPSPVFLFLSK